MHLTFKHNQILVIGEFGQGKTTLCVHHALHKAYWWGHPVFSNAAALFGRRISPEELHTCIVDMPRDGVLFIEEASAASESGMGEECPNDIGNSSYESVPYLARVLTRRIGVLAACIFSPSRHDTYEAI